MTLFLNNLAINGPDDTDLHKGICPLVDQDLKPLMAKWPHYSGSPTIPVPGGANKYLSTKNKWDVNTEYGRLRRDLCNILATQLQYPDVTWFLEDLAAKRREPYYHTSGICGNILTHLDYKSDVLTKLKSFLPKWPYYTGDENYPIPGGAYMYNRSGNKWEENTTYGQLRYDLCKFWTNKLFDYLGD